MIPAGAFLTSLSQTHQGCELCCIAAPQSTWVPGALLVSLREGSEAMEAGENP